MSRGFYVRVHFGLVSLGVLNAQHDFPIELKRIVGSNLISRSLEGMKLRYAGLSWSIRRGIKGVNRGTWSLRLWFQTEGSEGRCRGHNLIRRTINVEMWRAHSSRLHTTHAVQYALETGGVHVLDSGVRPEGYDCTPDLATKFAQAYHDSSTNEENESVERKRCPTRTQAQIPRKRRRRSDMGKQVK